MADDFGLKIGLEGEKEFKKALTEINQTFKVLGSEMKLVSSQFDKNDNSVQALTARNQVLNKEIEAQKQKIETLRSALQNAAESFGENDRRTQNWQIQLNNAEAALNGMERELSDNEKAIDAMGDENCSPEGRQTRRCRCRRHWHGSRRSRQSDMGHGKRYRRGWGPDRQDVAEDRHQCGSLPGMVVCI